MKILHCLAQLPMKTGSGVYFTTLVEGMINKGHENAAVYGTQKPFSEQSLAQLLNLSAENCIKEFPVEFLTDSLPFPIAGMSDIMPYNSTVYSQMTDTMLQAWIDRFKKTLIDVQKDFQPDVIITHHLFILTSLVKQLFPTTRIIGISHGTDIRQIKQNPWIKEKYLQQLDQLAFYFTVSPKDVKEIETIFNIPSNNIKSIGGGFNPAIFNDQKRHHFDGTFRLVYAGKISDSKGVFELVKALPIILQRYPNTELTLIGNATEEQKERLYRNAEYSTHLKLVNASSQLCMSRILKQNDIFILPSYYEALGLVAIEALACGLFAVTTEIEGLMKLLGEAIKTSGIIEYVKLPRIYDVDKAYEEDKPLFVQNLAQKVLLQMARVESGQDVYSGISEEIKKHSWASIIDGIEQVLQQSHEDTSMPCYNV